MLLRFEDMESTVLPGFYGGEKELSAKLYQDEAHKILLGCLEPGASIGMHTHELGSETIYFLQGSGRVLYDDGWEQVSAGMCHHCPTGHSHSLVNDTQAPLQFFAVVSKG